MSKPNLIKRIVKVEQITTQPRWKVAIYDESLKVYSGQDIGGILTPLQFNAWYAKQDKDTQVIIVRVCDNNTKLIIENHVDKNTSDLLAEYEAILKEETANRCDEIIKISRTPE
jgi:hypothetical protein